MFATAGLTFFFTEYSLIIRELCLKEYIKRTNWPILCANLN